MKQRRATTMHMPLVVSCQRGVAPWQDTSSALMMVHA